MQREHHVQWICSRTKREREEGTAVQRGEMSCVPRLNRDTSLSIQRPVDHINDWGLTEIGMLPGQTGCCCSKEGADASPSAQWLMRWSQGERSVAGYRKAVVRVGDMVSIKYSWV